VKGNLTVNQNGNAYGCDFDNRMTGANTDGNPGDEATFEYDALGRRVRKNNGTTNTVYILAGQLVVGEYASGAVPASPSETFVYASYIDEPIFKRGTGGDVYYSRNQQYSITALTDSTGNVVERYSYDAHGTLTIFNGTGNTITATAFANPYTYTARRFDSETGLNYFRARYYDSILGRFISRDPFGFVDGMSLYRGYFVPGGNDFRGTLAARVTEPLEAYSCNSDIHWVTTVEWELGPAERDGFIVQKVCDMGVMFDCEITECSYSTSNNEYETKEFFTLGGDLAKERLIWMIQNLYYPEKSCYLELWVVIDGKIYRTGEWADEDVRFESGRDRFREFSSSNIEFSLKDATATFIPSADVLSNPPKGTGGWIDWVLWRDGRSGDLPSKKVAVDDNSIFAGRTTINRQITFVKNCCPPKFNATHAF
jgi:RHS repeat-associated protein